MQPLNFIPNSSPHCLNNFDWMSHLPVGWVFPGDISHHVCDNLSLSVCVCVRKDGRKSEHIGLSVVWKPGRVHSYRPTRSLRSPAPSVTLVTHTRGRTFIQSITLAISVYFLFKNHTLHNFQWTHACIHAHKHTHMQTKCCHCRSIHLCHSRPPGNSWYLTANMDERKETPSATDRKCCECVCVCV